MAINVYAFLKFGPSVTSWDRDVVPNAPPNAVMSPYHFVLDSKGSTQTVFLDNQVWNFEKDKTYYDLIKDVYGPVGDKEFRAAGRVDTTGKSSWGKVHFKWINLIVKGIEYNIPDIWWSLGEDTKYGFITNNWGDYECMHVGDPGAAKSTMKVLAWENGCYGVKTKPVFLTLTVDANGVIDITKDRDLSFSAPDDFVDEFNYKLALNRINKGFSGVPINKALVGTFSGVSPQNLYVKMGGYTAGLQSCSLNVIESSVSTQAEKDYVSLATLRNATDAPMNIKTSDYAHTLTETLAATLGFTVKTGASYTIKESMKFKENILIEQAEATVEQTAVFSAEFTETASKTWTHTDTKTFTVSGQTVSVPAKSSVKVQTEWWRAKISGTTEIIFPLVNSPNASVTTIAHTDTNESNEVMSGLLAPASVVVDMAQAKAILDLNTVRSEASINGKTTPGQYVAGHFGFTSEVGVMANYSVDPAPFVVPQAD